MKQDHTKNPNTKQEVEQLLALSDQEKHAKQKRRYDVVRLYLEGYQKQEIADIFHIATQTVSSYLRRYKQGGVQGLRIKKQTGQPRKLTDEQEQELMAVLSSHTPKQEGLGPFQNWTAPLACCFVEKRFGVTFSERGMRDVFYRIGLSYTRPTYTLKKADPEKQEAFHKQLEAIKKTSDGGD